MSIINRIYGKNKIVDFMLRKSINISLVLHLKKHNEKKEVYVIQARGNSGFFSMWFYAIGNAMYAKSIRGGYKCVIDWKTYPTPYTESKPVNGTTNPFEYYFEQPDDISVSDHYDLLPYYSEDKYPYGMVPYYGVSNIFNEGKPTHKQIKRINEFFRAHCPIKKSILDEFEETASQLDLSNCIAVHIRGTDMNFTKGHNKSAGINQVIEVVNKEMNKYGISKVFLCTDENVIVDKMRQEFDDSIVCMNAYRSKDGKQGIHLESNDSIRKNHRYMMGYEVLRDAYLMSKCKAIVCGKSNVAYAAIVFNNNKYQHVAFTN